MRIELNGYVIERHGEMFKVSNGNATLFVLSVDAAIQFASK